MSGRAQGRRRAALWLTVIAGVALLALAVALVARNLGESRAADQAAGETLAQLDGQIADRAASASAEGAIVWQLDREMPTAWVDGRDWIGVISIPSLNIELPILATWDEGALRTGACRYSGSYYTDDLVVGAYNYSSFFGPLLNAQVGVDVYLTNADGRRIRYTVSNRETLRATAVSQLVENRQNSDAASDWDLTLFTCDVSGTARCAVRCVRQ